MTQLIHKTHCMLFLRFHFLDLILSGGQLGRSGSFVLVLLQTLQTEEGIFSEFVEGHFSFYL